MFMLMQLSVPSPYNIDLASKLHAFVFLGHPDTIIIAQICL